MEIRAPRLTSTRVLPDSYAKVWGLDLSQDQKTALVLNLVSLPLFVLGGWLLLSITAAFKPGIADLASLRVYLVHPLPMYLTFFAVVVGFMVLHEAIHGLFFWLFTRTRPLFGIKLLFAYAGAPEWYIPRDQYLVIGLSPFVLITLIGMSIIMFAPTVIAQALLFGVVMNVGGAVGDLYVCAKVMSHSGNVLVNDTGFVFAMFEGSARDRSPMTQQ